MSTVTKRETSSQRTRRYWPALAAVLALPVVAGVVAVLLLWTVHLWNVPLWAVVLVGLPLVVVGEVLVWYLVRRFSMRRFRFGLRGMIVAVTIVGLLFATVGPTVHQRLRREHALRQVAAHGGRGLPMDPRELNWLRSRLGVDPFGAVEVVWLHSDEATDSLLQHTDQFAEVEMLSFWEGPTDESLARAAEFNNFPRLTSAEFVDTPLTDEGLRRLRAWHRVEFLFFNGCAISDDGLRHLVELPALEDLTLIADQGGNMSITNASTIDISKMTGLKRLFLQGIPISDAGLARLAELPNLERVILRGTAVTETGAEIFRAVQTDCWLIGMKDELPTVNQIRQIYVVEDGAPTEDATVIEDVEQVAQIKDCIERLIAQYNNGWQFEPEVETAGGTWIELVGRRRSLCRWWLGERYFQKPNISFQADGNHSMLYFELPEQEVSEFDSLLDAASASEID